MIARGELLQRRFVFVAGQVTWVGERLKRPPTIPLKTTPDFCHPP